MFVCMRHVVVWSLNPHVIYVRMVLTSCTEKKGIRNFIKSHTRPQKENSLISVDLKLVRTLLNYHVLGTSTEYQIR